MNRIKNFNFYQPTAAAFHTARQQALQEGFDAGREYERERMASEWCGDVSKAYNAGVADVARREMWWALRTGFTAGVAASALAWGLFG